MHLHVRYSPQTVCCVSLRQSTACVLIGLPSGDNKEQSFSNPVVLCLCLVKRCGLIGGACKENHLMGQVLHKNSYSTLH